MASSTTVQKLQPEHAYLFERHSIAGKPCLTAARRFGWKARCFWRRRHPPVLAGSAGCKVVILQCTGWCCWTPPAGLALDELNDKLRQGGRALVLCGAGGDTAKMLVDSTGRTCWRAQCAARPGCRADPRAGVAAYG